MAKLLTVKEIESKRPIAKPYKFAVDRGLYIRVPTSGIKTWLVRYVVEGRQIDYALPKPYGLSGDGFMSLAEAKTLNATIQALAKTGIDYQDQQAENLQQKKDEVIAKVEAEKAEHAKNLTFKDLFDVWIKDGVSRADGNEMIIRTFKNHAFPKLGNIPLRELTESNLLDALRSIFNQSKTRTAIMLFKDIGQMLRWAEKRKPYRALMIDGNPAELVDIEILIPSDYEEERDRYLSVDEIRKLNAIFLDGAIAYEKAPNKYEADRPLIKETQIALWICLSTLSRIGELLKTEWKHVDFEARTWFIPKENVKGTRRNKQAQLVYLSDFTLNLFKQLHTHTGESKWAFPAKNNSTHNKNHVCVKSVSKQVGDRQTQFKQRTKELSKRVNNNTLALGDTDWTPHDLRRTGATMMQGDLKISLDVIDRCQNHVLAGSKVRRHYLHHEYAEEKREAWEKLGDRLAAILKADNVVSLKVA
jgi:integrase